MSNTSIYGDKLIKIQQVLAIYPVSRATWWRGIKAGKYPAGIKLTVRTTVWSQQAIDRLIESAKGGGV